MALDTRWKNPQGDSNQLLYLWAQDLIKELRAGRHAETSARFISTNAPVYDLASNVLGVAAIFPLDSAAQTVPAGKQFDFIRLSQLSGADITFTIGAGGQVNGYSAYLTSSASSNAASNLYPAVFAVTNAGPGTTKAQHLTATGSGTSAGVLIASNAEITPVATQGYASAYFSSLTSSGVNDKAVGYGIESSGDRYLLGFGNTIAAVSVSSAYYRAWLATGSGANARAFQVLNNAGSEIAYWHKDGVISVPGGANLIKTLTALTNNAGAAAGTLGNAPTAGNPTKWIAIDDNGTVRKIPTWT